MLVNLQGRNGRSKLDILGLSMLELLVATGLLCVLAALLIPVFGHLQRTKDNVTCASNLRQIGTGIVLYANDFTGRLPGPLLPGQFPYWDHYTQLAWHLRDYLEVNKNREKEGRLDVFVCPAYQRHVGEIGKTAVFALSGEIVLSGEQEPVLPFGYPNTYWPYKYNTRKDFPAVTLLDLNRIVDEDGRPAKGRTWAIKDANQKDLRFVHGGTPQSSMPDTKVHGSFNIALFFDFSVGRTDLTPQTSSN